MSSLKSSLADNKDFQELMQSMPREDGRKVDEPRVISITPQYTMHAQGSVFVEVGNTKVICTACVEDGVPHFMRGEKSGWLTAEYGMLPGSTAIRKKRPGQGKTDGRAQEIQRLIGRSLRAIIDLSKIGERTIWIDCDVIQADGGTRTASITGGFVALVLAVRYLYENKKIKQIPITQQLAAISVGIVNERTMLDLKYEEDRDAEVDMNVVMLDDQSLIEVQGTAEGKPFSREQFNTMLDYAQKGLVPHFEAQQQALHGYLIKPPDAP